MAQTDIGCCGAYCKPCRAFTSGACRGCRHGYASGARDLAKAKCVLKVCCLQKGYQICADCPAYDSCPSLAGFYGKNGAKYRKYQQATRYIRDCGYDAFVRIADAWTGACGKYPRQGRPVDSPFSD